ncbi:MAG: dsbd3, partial [Phycisphaerales bacterium]|nr:dsbd3 [Phycisphaerales bacterium]
MTRHLFACVTAAFLGLTAAQSAVAKPAGPDGNALVTAAVVADVAAVAPGKPFRVGVRLTVSPGWHVYWQNPGDAGLPTVVELRLPPGFAHKPFGFPTPVRFDQPGDVVGFGYEGELMVVAEVTPPADLPLGRPVRVSAEADWLVC